MKDPMSSHPLFLSQISSLRGERRYRTLKNIYLSQNQEREDYGRENVLLEIRKESFLQVTK